MLKRVAFFLLLLASAALAADPTPAAKITGVLIASPTADEDLAGPAWREGTTLRLEMAVVDNIIVNFDRDNSRLQSLKDDKGTDLLGGKEADNFQIGFGPFDHYAKDRKRVNVELHAPKAPAAGATAILLQGQASLQVASQTKDVSADNVAMKVGTAFKLGDIPLKITKIGKPSWGDGTAVTVQTDRELDVIASLEFIDAAGKTVEFKPGDGSTISMGTVKTVEKEYVFTELPARATLKAKLWADLHTVKVPVDAKIGLGL